MFYIVLFKLHIRNPRDITAEFLGSEVHSWLDLFDHLQLAGTADNCKESNSMAEAGRRLFDQNRESKKFSNDSHRLRQLLAKFGVTFSDLKELTL